MLKIAVIALVVCLGVAEIAEDPEKIVESIFGAPAKSLPVAANCQKTIADKSVTCVRLVDAKWNKSKAVKDLDEATKNKDDAKVKELTAEINCCALFDNEDCVEPRVKVILV